MSLTKRQRRIQKTLEFLERDELQKQLARERRAQEREESRHKKDVTVVESARPVYFWHWKVHKNSCNHGYMYIKTRFRINAVDQVVRVEDDEILTVPTTPRVGGGGGSAHHTPRPPDSRPVRPPDTFSPRPSDKATPRSARSQASRLSINMGALGTSQDEMEEAPAVSSTPRASSVTNVRTLSGVRRSSARSAATNASVNVPNSARSASHSHSASGGTGRKGGKEGRKSGSQGRGGKGRVMVTMLRGLRVVARNDKDGLYYPGRVVRCPNVRHATVEFTDGQRDALTRFILPISGAVACPPLAVGDYTLVQVVNLDQSSECYVPGIVQVMPQRRQAQAQFYTVMLYNDQKVTTSRTHLVKISKERFELSARYILAIQREEKKQKHRSKARSRSPEVRIGSRSSSRSMSRSRSRSRSRSLDSQASSRSSSRSRSPESRPRSPTPGIGLRGPHTSLPRSEGVSPDIAIIGRKDVERSRNFERNVRSHSYSRSSSKSPTRQDSVSKSRSRSRSRSASRDSRSSRSRSRSSGRDSPQSRSRSRSLDSPLKSGSRSRSRGESPSTPVTERRHELKRLQKQLEKQKKHQERERRKLKRKARKLKEKKQRLHAEEEERSDKEKAAVQEEPEEEEPPLLTPRLLHLRRTLPKLQTAEEVLARYSDDGWYYRGTVQQDLGDMSYVVEDATGYIERIWREDIISDYDDNAPPLKIDDRVVAQHPSHCSSYAPGCVVAVDDVQQTAVVRFYDGVEGSVARTEVYRLPQDKYNHDVLHIQQCQRSMLGLSVVARDDRYGEYYPGQVMGLDEGGQQYIVRWSDGSQSSQHPLHIFSARTRRQRLLIGDRVLAIANPEEAVFMPGQIIGAHEGGLIVRFCNGIVSEDVNPTICYWLSQGYFEEATYFWKISQPDFGKRR